MASCSKLSRHWCFEIPNQSDCRIESGESIRYVIWQVERSSADDPRPKVVGYIELSAPTRQSSRIIPGAKLIERTGTREEARHRCMCPDGRIAGPFEYGRWELRQGRKPRSATPEPSDELTGRNHTGADTTPKSGSEVRDVNHALLDTLSCMQKKMESLEAMMLQVKERSPTIINNTITNNNSTTTNNNTISINNTQNNNIIIRDNGHEDLSDFPMERLKELIPRMSPGFLEFLIETRFNADKPQNRNVRIRSKKRNVAVLKKDGHWLENSIAQCLEEVLTGCVAQFFRPFNDREYIDKMSDEKPCVMDWHNRIVAKAKQTWHPIKNRARAELEKVYDLERKSVALSGASVGDS